MKALERAEKLIFESHIKTGSVILDEKGVYFTVIFATELYPRFFGISRKLNGVAKQVFQ